MDRERWYGISLDVLSYSSHDLSIIIEIEISLESRWVGGGGIHRSSDRSGDSSFRKLTKQLIKGPPSALCMDFRFRVPHCGLDRLVGDIARSAPECSRNIRTQKIGDEIRNRSVQNTRARCQLRAEAHCRGRRDRADEPR